MVSTGFDVSVSRLTFQGKDKIAFCIKIIHSILVGDSMHIRVKRAPANVSKSMKLKNHYSFN